MKTKTQLDEEILAAWDMFETAEPDISTERLIQKVADFCRCDCSRVTEACFRENEAENEKDGRPLS